MANSGSGSINTNTGTQHNYNNTGAQYNNCTFNVPIDDEAKERWQKVRQWLSPPDQDVDHDIARARWEPATGEWLLRRQEYQKWKEGILWLNGKPGCGKTVLCSSVIEDLKSRENVLYFYFTFSDARKQTLDGMLRSFATQVARLKPGPWLQLMGEATPSVHVLSRALQETLEHQHVIVIDALDECPEDHRLEILRWLTRQTRRVFVTSRYIQNIADYLASRRQVRIENSDIAADIAIYAERQLANEPRLAAFTPAIKAKIRQSVTQRADGMFRWAALLLDEMVNLKRSSEKEIEAALARFPQKLDNVYERILADCSDKQQVFTLLQWITYGANPLTLSQLTEVLTINVENDVVDPTDRCEPSDIMRLLMSLVIPVSSARWLDVRLGYLDGQAVRDRTTLRLAHYTVQEYLESTRILDTAASRFQLVPHVAHFAITKGCLTYLAYWTERGMDENYRHGPFGNDATAEETTELLGDRSVINLLSEDGRPPPAWQYDCLAYWADRSWPLHSLLHDRPDVQAEVEFLMNDALRKPWVKRPGVTDALIQLRATWTFRDDALSWACAIKAPKIVPALCALGALNDVKNPARLLFSAVSTESITVVESLLQAGLDPAVHGNVALRSALLFDQLAMARVLLDAGARSDVRLPCYSDRSPHYNDTLRELVLDNSITISWIPDGG